MALHASGLGHNLLLGDGVTVGADVTFGANVVVYDDTVIGDGCFIQDGAVLGKVPSLGAVAYRGTTLGAGCILGDYAGVRERCTLGEKVVVGRGSVVENDTTIGDGTKIQTNVYITAYMTIEERCFIAPCVQTTNDNFMGRTEKRHKLIRGATIRRGARIGGGVVLCPAIEIGEEAFIAAGAVVTKDAPARKVLMGVPARVVRDVYEDELLENQ